MKKKRVRRKKVHHVIGTIKPKQIVSIEEPHLVVAVPKTLWERFMNWLAGNEA